MRRSTYIPLLVCCVLLPACLNPFAPRLRDGDLNADLLGNPQTIEGFYTRFQAAYQLRDTTLYGPLIDPGFIFVYRDYDRNVDVEWGRAEDMTSTFNLFQYSREIQLTWNNVVAQFRNEENTQAQVIRRFLLVVILEGSDVIRTDGSANFYLQRADSTETWRLINWRDQSDL